VFVALAGVPAWSEIDARRTNGPATSGSPAGTVYVAEAGPTVNRDVHETPLAATAKVAMFSGVFGLSELYVTVKVGLVLGRFPGVGAIEIVGLAEVVGVRSRLTLTLTSAGKVRHEEMFMRPL
jgi:hypothetical protein